MKAGSSTHCATGMLSLKEVAACGRKLGQVPLKKCLPLPAQSLLPGCCQVRDFAHYCGMLFASQDKSN